MTQAKTPKGKIVEVAITAEYGTARLQMGRIYYGGIAVSGWSEGGSGTKTLKEALDYADQVINERGLTDDVSTMSIRDVPESLRLMFRGKALQESKNMQEKIIELMQEYVNKKEQP